MGLKHLGIEVMRRRLPIERAPAIGIHPAHGGADAMQRLVKLRQLGLARQMRRKIAAADLVAQPQAGRRAAAGRRAEGKQHG